MLQHKWSMSSGVHAVPAAMIKMYEFALPSMQGNQRAAGSQLPVQVSLQGSTQYPVVNIPYVRRPASLTACAIQVLPCPRACSCQASCVVPHMAG